MEARGLSAMNVSTRSMHAWMGTKRARDDTGCVGEGGGQGEVSGQHAHDSRHRGVKRQSRALARTQREREVVKRKTDEEDGAEGGVSGASRKMSKNDSGELGVTRMSTTDDCNNIQHWYERGEGGGVT